MVVATWNGRQWIEGCLGSIASQALPIRLVVVDNASTDGTIEILENRRDFFENTATTMEVLRLDSNTGFATAVNRGLQVVFDKSRPVEGILLLNQDATLEHDCLEAFNNALTRNPRSAAIGARILFPGGRRIQHAGGYLERPRMVGLHFGHNEFEEVAGLMEEREVEFVTGAAMMLRATALAEVGLFNEVFSPGYYEDVELCDRFRTAGWSVVYAPTAKVIHYESSSFSDPDARLRLAHRNRYIYALPRFRDSEFCEDFVRAESEFLEQRATFDEVRAVSGGTLEVLARLSELSALRVDERTDPRSFIASARRVLTEIRNTCNLALRIR